MQPTHRQYNHRNSQCTLDIRPEKKDSKIHPATVHQHIFDAVKTINNTAVIITSNNIPVTHSKDLILDVEHAKMFSDIRTDAVTKRIYLFFKLESTHKLSQLKFGSKHDGITGIFNTLSKNFTFIKLNKFQS